jgi:hypothetical protein
MKTIAVLALVASLLTAAPALAVAPGPDGLCGPDAPDAYKRPGGYCDTLDQGGSLSLPITNGPVIAGQVASSDEKPDVVVVSGCELPAEGGNALC